VFSVPLQQFFSSFSAVFLCIFSGFIMLFQQFYHDFQQFFYAFSVVLLCYFSSFTMIFSSFIMLFQQFYYAFSAPKIHVLSAPNLFLFLLIFRYS